MVDHAANLRRIMARQGLTLEQVVERTGLDARTVQAILLGRNARPHARTLHRLAAGLDIPADELFVDSAVLAQRVFDRHTNPLVEEAVAARPAMFEGWTEAQFDELHSRFGAGGALTREGALAAAEAMNRNRQVHDQVALLLETAQAELLREIVAALYRRVAILPGGIAPGITSGDPLRDAG